MLTAPLALSAGVGADECLDHRCDYNVTVAASGGVSPSVTVTSTSPMHAHGSGGPSRRVPDWVRSCRGRRASASDVLGWLRSNSVDFGVSDLSPEYDPAGEWVLLTCPGHPNPLLGGEVIDLYEVDEPSVLAVDVVVAQAYASTLVPLPEPKMSPAGSVDRPWLTQLDTWLWLDEADVAPVRATASLPGVSATVAAVPSGWVTWMLQDATGTTRTRCRATGRAPHTGSAEPSDCVFEPAATSESGPAAVSVITEWGVSVSCVPACRRALPSTIRSTTVDVTIIEIVGLVSD